MDRRNSFDGLPVLVPVRASPVPSKRKKEDRQTQTRDGGGGQGPHLHEKSCPASCDYRTILLISPIRRKLLEDQLSGRGGGSGEALTH